MTPATARWAAWLLWLLASAVILVGGAINVIDPGTIDPNLPSGRARLIAAPILVLLWFAFPTLGALIIARHPQNAVGWLVFAGGLSEDIRGSTETIALLLNMRGDVLPLGGAVALLHQEARLTLPLLSLALLFFPDGHLPSPRWRLLALLIGCVAVLDVVLSPVGSWMRSSAAELDATYTPGGVLLVLTSSLRRLELLALIGVAMSLVVRFRAAGLRTRQQIKWIAAASIVAAITAVAFWLPGGWAWSGTLGPLELPVEFAYLSAVLCVPTSIGIAMLRHRLLDIDVLINRTLVYGATVATLGVLYVSAIVALQTVLRPFTQGDELAVALSTLAAIALFNPLRTRVQRSVDRRFYRSRYDATRTLDLLAVRLRDQVDLDALRAELLTAVRDTMQPAHASLWLRERAR